VVVVLRTTPIRTRRAMCRPLGLRLRGVEVCRWVDRRSVKPLMLPSGGYTRESWPFTAGRTSMLQVHVHRSDRMASLTTIDHTFDYSHSCPSGRQAGREDPRLSTTS